MQERKDNLTDSKLKSLTEAFANVLVGWPIAHASNLVILIPVVQPMSDSINRSGVWSWETQGWILGIGLLYTLFSIGRQYLFRRMFERFGPNTNPYTLLVRIYNRIRWGSVV